MPPGQICAPVKGTAIHHLDKPGSCRTFRRVEGVLPAMKLQENLLDQVFRLPLISENTATNGKGKVLITLQQDQKCFFVAILQTFQKLFV